MRWLLQNNIFNEAAFDILLETVGRFGFEHSVHDVVPFAGELVPEPPAHDGKTIAFGSYSMRHSARKYGWTPGLYLMEHAQPRAVQNERWGTGNLLNGAGVETALGNAAEAAAAVLGVHDVDRVFIRPAQDSKVFSGTFMTASGLSEWIGKVEALGEDADASLNLATEVLVAPPRGVVREWRNWVVGGRIVTSSLYKLGTRVVYEEGIDPPALRFAGEMIRRWDPAPAYVMDVCEIDTGGYAIVEVQCVNSSGFYAGDVQKIVAAIADLEGA
jgi:hypothetical protein